MFGRLLLPFDHGVLGLLVSLDIPPLLACLCASGCVLYECVRVCMRAPLVPQTVWRTQNVREQGYDGRTVKSP